MGACVKAREVFEQARDAVMVIKEHEYRLQIMRDRIGVQGRALESSFSQNLDPMRKVDDLLEWELDEEAAMASSYAAVEDAKDLIRGLYALGGSDNVRTLQYVYLDAMDVADAARKLGQTPEVVRLMCVEMFSWIDSTGIAKVKEAGREQAQRLLEG